MRAVDSRTWAEVGGFWLVFLGCCFVFYGREHRPVAERCLAGVELEAAVASARALDEAR